MAPFGSMLGLIHDLFRYVSRKIRPCETIKRLPLIIHRVVWAKSGMDRWAPGVPYTAPLDVLGHTR